MAAIFSGYPVAKSASVSIPNVHRHQESRHGATTDADFAMPKFHEGSKHDSRRYGFGFINRADTLNNHAARDHSMNDVSTRDKDMAESGRKKASFQLLAQASDTDSITPQLLAKHQLPAILLQHGPLAIRHITGLLISVVPGFSSISPARQRRLVVGALEGRGVVSGAHGEIGGIEGNVLFEKVGWGRWDARVKGDPPREQRFAAPAYPDVKSLGVTTAEMQRSTSYTGESGIFIHSEGEEMEDITRRFSDISEDHNMDDADCMSPDDSTGTSSYDDDMTDEEDWAQMGAALLRQQGASPITSDGWGNSFARSPPMFSFESPEAKRMREEREAVEALVKLSSV